MKIQNLKIFRKKPKNRGLGTKNQKITSNISKLEYFEGFWLKIQKLKIFVKKPKNHIFRGPKLKKFPFHPFFPFFVQNGHPLFAPPYGVKSLKWAPPHPRGTPSWNEGVLLFQNPHFPTTPTAQYRMEFLWLTGVFHDSQILY